MLRSSARDSDTPARAARPPFTLARPEAVDYDESLCPGTYEALRDVLVLPWNEVYSQEHIDYIAETVRSSAAELTQTANGTPAGVSSTDGENSITEYAAH